MTKFNLKAALRYEDAHLIVLNKAAGLLSQGEKKGDPNLVDELRRAWGHPFVGLVHRLDRNTSGLMVVAKRSKAALRLTEALQKGELKRQYEAWVQGHLEGTFRWQHWLLKDEAKNRVKVFREAQATAKEAVLSGRSLETRELRPHASTGADSSFGAVEISRLELELETGRSHQIRAQAAAERHALVGDLKYGSNQLHSALRTLGRPALHSAHLEFRHPMSDELMTFAEPWPADVLEWLAS